MKVFIIKEDDYYWYEIREFATLEAVYAFMLSHDKRLLLERNPWKSEKDFKYWTNMKSEDIPVITQIPLQIVILKH